MKRGGKAFSRGSDFFFLLFRGSFQTFSQSGMAVHWMGISGFNASLLLFFVGSRTCLYYRGGGEESG